MFYKFGTTIDLMKASWRLLKKDKEILFFPFCATLMSFGLIALFVWMPQRPFASNNDLQMVGIVIAMMYALYFIISWFNAGVIACANIRIQGGNPNITHGLYAMLSRVHMIFVWALITGTVGILINLIESRFKRFGEFIGEILGAIWSIVSFFVVTLIVIEKRGPFDALGESSSKIKQTWGEHLVSNFSFGLIFVVLIIPGVAITAFGMNSHNDILIWIGIAYMVIVSLINSAVETIFRVVMYYYVYHDFIAEGFDEKVLKSCYEQENQNTFNPTHLRY